MPVNHSKLALGTVQFGLDYGINNQHGQVSYQNVKEILTLAHRNGIGLLDTAVAYGDSEAVLGKALQELQLPFDVVSKLPPKMTQGEVVTVLNKSLERLQIDRLYACLFHNFEDFEQTPALFDELVQAKHQGKVNKVGFSVYYPQQITFLLKKGIPFDLVQLPYNVFDQRFGELFPLLKEQGIEIHTRSTFLQGLFFKNRDILPKHFNSVANKIESLRQLSKTHQIPLAVLLLNFVQLQPDIDQVVIGVDLPQHLKDNLISVDFLEKTRNIYSDLQQLKENNEQIILPFHWM